MRASRYVKRGVLFSLEDFSTLLHQLAPLLFPVGALVEKELLSQEEVVQYYKDYLEGALMPTIALTMDRTAIVTKSYLGKFLNTIDSPVVLMRSHALYIDEGEKKVFSQVNGQITYPWGVEFSFPTIFQRDGEGVQHSNQTKNWKFFRSLEAFLREKTKPAKFLVGNEEIVTPYRVSICLKSSPSALK